MEKDGLIIVSIMLISFVVLAFSVGRITGLVTNNSEVEETQEICTEDCDPETCQEQECLEEDCNCSKKIN